MRTNQIFWPSPCTRRSLFFLAVHRIDYPAEEALVVLEDIDVVYACLEVIEGHMKGLRMQRILAASWEIVGMGKATILVCLGVSPGHARYTMG